MKLIKNYKLRFDIWGFVFFLIIMFPNFIYFAIPAPNDILRADSVTPIVDAIGSFCQIFFIIALCILQRERTPKIQANPLIIMVIVSVFLYFTGWIFYYIGVTNPLVILLLTIPPCSTFIFLAIDRKNIIALIPAIIFTICHITYAIINFII